MTDHPGRAALAAIMEAAEKATPGPWKRHTWRIERAAGPVTPAIAICSSRWDNGDADFIATARNNIASVSALVASLEAENTRLREALDECDDYFDSRADAELFTDSPLPVENEEMRLLCVVRAALGGDNG